MINFSDSVILNILETTRKYPKWKDILRERMYRVSDIGLSYRQVNSIQAGDLLPDKRKSQKGWRLLNACELVYLLTISETRKYGLNNSQLKSLKNSLFDDVVDLFGFQTDLTYGEIAILYALIGERVGLMILDNGKSFFTDSTGFVYVQGDALPEKTSYLYININEIILKIFKETTINKYASDYKSLRLTLQRDLFHLNNNDLKVIEMLQNTEYKQLTIVKQSDTSVLIKAELNSKVKNMQEVSILMDRAPFADIQVTKRDGTIVGAKIEEVIKLPPEQ